MSAAGEAVAGVRVEQAVHLVVEEGVHVGVGALHLAVDHAVAAGASVLAELVVPALLQEDLLSGMDQRAEHGVKVDGHEVEKVLLVAARDGVDRLVAEGHGVEIGLHGALQQGHERLPHRIFLGAVEHAVLEDVEHAGVVLRQGLEADRKGLVLRRPVEVEQLRAGLFMAQETGVRRPGGEALLPRKHEAVQTVAGLCGTQRGDVIRHKFSLWGSRPGLIRWFCRRADSIRWSPPAPPECPPPPPCRPS